MLLYLLFCLRYSLFRPARPSPSNRQATASRCSNAFTQPTRRHRALRRCLSVLYLATLSSPSHLVSPCVCGSSLLASSLRDRGAFSLSTACSPPLRVRCGGATSSPLLSQCNEDAVESKGRRAAGTALRRQRSQPRLLSLFLHSLLHSQSPYRHAQRSRCITPSRLPHWRKSQHDAARCEHGAVRQSAVRQRNRSCW